MNQRECAAYARLVDALPDHMVLAQVPLSRFLSVPKRNSYADWLRRIGYQCVDFAICDMAAQVIAVVELQAPGSSDRAQKRLARISRTLKAAQIPLQVWSEHALPNVEVARELLASLGCQRLAVVYDRSQIGTRHLKYLQDEADLLGLGLAATFGTTSVLLAVGIVVVVVGMIWTRNKATT